MITIIFLSKFRFSYKLHLAASKWSPLSKDIYPTDYSIFFYYWSGRRLLKQDWAIFDSSIMCDLR